MAKREWLTVFEIPALEDRGKPGLPPQHLMAVQSAATTSHAKVPGAQISSQTLALGRTRVKGGKWGINLYSPTPV